MDPQVYYSRQIRLSEIGQQGQEKLKNAKCLVIGAGGLGSPALLYLAAAGVGTIGICDGDVLEESNLHRQPLYFAKDVGKPKAELAAARLKELNPFINVSSYAYRLTAENAQQLFSTYDLVLDCTDNFRTKFLINDAAYLLKKPVVRASIYQFEGQLQTYIPQRGDACLRCLWEDVPQEGCVGSCQQVGVIGPLPGFFGTLQAMEALKFFLGMPTLGAHEILFTDLIYYSQRTIAFEKKPSCPLCGNSPKIFDLKEREAWELKFDEISDEYILVDIREPEETELDPYQGSHVKMPLSSFDETYLESHQNYLFFCQRGMRSARLVQALREKGIENVFSLIGGVKNGRS
jgi:molybdopterin/thiamine biosynthesis adenylyltransferase/rhodanese-related sulfurtransferase